MTGLTFNERHHSAKRGLVGDLQGTILLALHATPYTVFIFTLQYCSALHVMGCAWSEAVLTDYSTTTSAFVFQGIIGSIHQQNAGAPRHARGASS